MFSIVLLMDWPLLCMDVVHVLLYNVYNPDCLGIHEDLVPAIKHSSLLQLSSVCQFLVPPASTKANQLFMRSKRHSC